MNFSTATIKNRKAKQVKGIDIFHVHTYRCRHAEMCSDEEYVKKAISIGAKSIAFTDHAPFPDNPFGDRMKMDSLSEYISSLQTLREQFKENIEIIIGLEIEYFSEFVSYYSELVANPDIDILLLGQHMYSINIGKNSSDLPKYSFSLPKEQLQKEEYIGLGESIAEGIESGFFDAVAHPDRIFRKRNFFRENERKISEKIIEKSIKYNIPLEINKSSIDTGLFVSEFWKIARDMKADIIYGYDAHSLEEIQKWKKLVL